MVPSHDHPALFPTREQVAQDGAAIRPQRPENPRRLAGRGGDNVPDVDYHPTVADDTRLGGAVLGMTDRF